MAAFERRIAELIIKELKGELNETERLELNEWLDASQKNREQYSFLLDDEILRNELSEIDERQDAVWQRIDAGVSEMVNTAIRLKKGKRRRFALTAIVVTVLLSAGAFWLISRPKEKDVAKKEQRLLQNDVAPGGNKATLTLADGRTIVLDSAQNGNLAVQGNATINKRDTILTYSASKEPSGSSGKRETIYNTLTTPRGGQYRLVLPDGSQVWLNAASSIRFPIAFPENSRPVEITGEAYFEVAHDRKRPFKVSILQSGPLEHHRAGVEVLGTTFNINAYSDENTIKATLLEGKIKVSVSSKIPDSATETSRGSGKGNYKLLVPGQQAQFNSTGQIQIIDDVDIKTTIAWKEGWFLYKKADVETMLKEAARWYDLEIEYPNGKPKERVTGGVTRNVNLSQFLSILEMIEVKCKLEGKKLIVMP